MLYVCPYLQSVDRILELHESYRTLTIDEPAGFWHDPEFMSKKTTSTASTNDDEGDNESSRSWIDHVAKGGGSASMTNDVVRSKITTTQDLKRFTATEGTMTSHRMYRFAPTARRPVWLGGRATRGGERRDSTRPSEPVRQARLAAVTRTRK